MVFGLGVVMSAIASMRHVYKCRKEWEGWVLDPTVTAETTSPTFNGPECPRCGSTVRYANRSKVCVRCLKQWRKQNRRKYEPKGDKRPRSNTLRKSHKLDRAAYRALWEKQNGLCGICGKPETDRNRTLSIDHCHHTGNFRGLLCGRCNRGLGQLGDTIEALEKALAYLRNNSWDL